MILVNLFFGGFYLRDVGVYFAIFRVVLRDWRIVRCEV